MLTEFLHKVYMKSGCRRRTRRPPHHGGPVAARRRRDRRLRTLPTRSHQPPTAAIHLSLRPSARWLRAQPDAARRGGRHPPPSSSFSLQHVIRGGEHAPASRRRHASSLPRDGEENRRARRRWSPPQRSRRAVCWRGDRARARSKAATVATRARQVFAALGRRASATYRTVGMDGWWVFVTLRVAGGGWIQDHIRDQRWLRWLARCRPKFRPPRDASALLVVASPRLVPARLVPIFPPPHLPRAPPWTRGATLADVAPYAEALIVIANDKLLDILPEAVPPRCPHLR